jgi:hypothetical protein
MNSLPSQAACSLVRFMRFYYVILMAFQSITKFLLGSRWVLGSLLFIADKFRDLSLQEFEPSEVTGSGTGHLSPAPVQVSLINKTQLRHESIKLEEASLDSSGDKADHNPAGSPATIDPIYQSPLKSDSVGDRKVYMVGQSEQPTEKTDEEIARAVEEEITRAADKEADKGKGTMACKTILGHLMMVLGTALP